MKRVCTVAGLVPLLGLLWSSPAFAQAPTFSARGEQIIDALVDKNLNLALGADDDRRALTKQIIEQLVFEFPGDGYGWKSADPNRPPSKDAIAVQRGAQLYAFDWQSGASRKRQVRAGDAAVDITGQTFIPVVGINHFAAAPMPTPGPISSPPPSLVVPTFDFAAAFERLYQQHERIYADETNQRTAQTATLKAAIDEPGFVTKIFGNRYVQLALAGLGTYLMTVQVKK